MSLPLFSSKFVQEHRKDCLAAWHRCLASFPSNSRDRFLAACRGVPLNRPPVWLMRQAGRVLPEYRALKEKFSFRELIQTPELAAEVTLQPIRRFGFDAAILFSDILVVPEALGQSFEFQEAGGVRLAGQMRDAADVERLDRQRLAERLQPALQAIRLARQQLRGQTALLGFAGSPWTLANFMLEGGSAREFTRAKQWFYTRPELFSRLMETLTDAAAEFLTLQIEAGVDAVQIFDSLGGVLSPRLYEPASASWIRKIIKKLDNKVPVIVFARGVHGSWAALGRTGADVISLDWAVTLSGAAQHLPETIGLQGNLDPQVLRTSPAIVAEETRSLLRSMRWRRGYIFNLGHGVPPNAPLENIQSLVETIRNFS